MYGFRDMTVAEGGGYEPRGAAAILRSMMFARPPVIIVELAGWPTPVDEMVLTMTFLLDLIDLASLLARAEHDKHTRSIIRVLLQRGSYLSRAYVSRA